MRSLDFVAVDFETANSERASVCQVGLAVVRGGALHSTDSWYVVPPTGLDSFHPVNISIHGITHDIVTSSQGLDWADSLLRFREVAGDLPLIAHNSPFDRSVYEESTRRIGQQVLSHRWEDTVGLSRRHLRLPDHKLPTVAAHLGLASFAHHDATADARACAEIALAISAQAGLRTFDELWPVRPAGRGGGAPRVFSRGYSTRKADLPAPDPLADSAHPLHGHHVVVTGEFDDRDRWEVFQALAAKGAQVQNGVTRQTTALIMADRPELPASYDLRTGTSKERKVHELRGKGQQIMVLDGRTAYTLLFD